MRERSTVRERNAVNENNAVISKFDSIPVKPRNFFQERFIFAPNIFPEVFRRHPLGRSKSVDRNLNKVAFFRKSIEFQLQPARNGRGSVKNKTLRTNESYKDRPHKNNNEGISFLFVPTHDKPHFLKTGFPLLSLAVILQSG